MMILLSLSESSVDAMVADLQSTVGGRVLKCLHTLKKRFLQVDLGIHVWMNVNLLRFVATCMGF